MFAENAAAQDKYWSELEDAGIVETESENERDSGGRKWFAALKQLGFVHLDDGTGCATVTAVGQTLLDQPELVDTIFLRQLLKYKIGSPLERKFTAGLNFRPFVTFLKMLYLAHADGLGGLTRDEIMIFVVPLMSEDDADLAAAFEKVRRFRQGYQAEQGAVAKRAFVDQQYAIYAPATPKRKSIRDYTDSNFRYARITGLLTVDGTGGRFKIAPSRMSFVETLLADLPSLLDDEVYLAALYNPEAPHLPLDDTAVVEAQLQELQTELRALGDEPEPASTGTATTLGQKQARNRTLQSRVTELTEIRFYRQQRSLDALQEIRELLENIRTKKLPAGWSYAPAFLEWALWRLLLAINDIRSPISSTRGFKVDDSVIPLHHAAPGAADCSFIYDDHIVVVEVTLTRSDRQTATEGIPVRRHVAKVMDEHPDKKVIGLFVAPSIDINTYDDFLSPQYRVAGERIHRLSIVPLTVKNIIELIDKMIEQNYIINSRELIIILNNLLESKQNTDDGKEWRRNINIAFKKNIADLASAQAVIANKN
ncbi:AlwI family type II restriction endonuclease [Deinococcus ruber]|uniref:AlwI family type II restriction endonuclease n=1 Tax=Deinococcus ruber TaxID=1848197 RepID=A0A918F6Z7_9DEIO|nr:AlwI family type II restriction endonuclease [Deinococcus ruber]GGR11208.1 hypothetical protein GCM10008957_24870 [Deinococcus ruber]